MTTRFLATHLLRRYWRATIILGVALGLAAAVPVTAWGVARRTDRAFLDFRDYAVEGLATMRTVAFCPAEFAEVPDFGIEGCRRYRSADEQRALTGWPEVAGAARFSGVLASLLTPNSSSPEHLTIDASFDPPPVIDGKLVTPSGRARLVAGRLPDSNAADEILTDDSFLDRHRMRLGDTIRLSLYSADEYERAADGAAEPTRGYRNARVVGVVRTPFDLQTSPGDRPASDDARVFIGPGVLKAFDDDVAAHGIGVFAIPREAEIDLEALIRERFADRPHETFDLLDQDSTALDAISRTVHLQANSVRLIALLSAATAFVLGSQALVRQIRRELNMRGTLSALGVRDSELRGTVILRSSPVIALGVVVCLAAAVFASPIGPVGIAARAELRPGIHADVWVLLIGFLSVAAALSVVAVIGSRQISPREAAPQRWSTWVNNISPMARAGIANTRHAPGQRRTAAASCGAAALVAVAAGVLTASFKSLQAHPSRYGTTWDAQVGNFSSHAQVAEGLAALGHVAHITAAGGFTGMDATISDHYAPLLSIDAVNGYRPITPTLTNGRLPANKDEIALAAPLARKFGVSIGDSVRISTFADGSPIDREFRLVGHVVLNFLNPPVDPKNGAYVHPSLILDESTDDQNYPQHLAVAVDPDFRHETFEALKVAFPNSYFIDVPPNDVRNLNSLSAAPTTFAVIAAVLAALSLLHTLLIFASASRRELAVLQTLGAQSHQLRSSLRWLTAALLMPPVAIGSILGLAGGYGAWRYIAGERGFNQQPAWAPGRIALVIITTALVIVISGCFSISWPAFITGHDAQSRLVPRQQA